MLAPPLERWSSGQRDSGELKPPQEGRCFGRCRGDQRGALSRREENGSLRFISEALDVSVRAVGTVFAGRAVAQDIAVTIDERMHGKALKNKPKPDRAKLRRWRGGAARRDDSA